MPMEIQRMPHCVYLITPAARAANSKNRLGVQMNPAISILLFVLLLPFTSFAQDIGHLTVREGNVHVIRGTSVLRAAEGMAMHVGDIIETPDAAFAQIELSGGTVIAVGPATKMYFLGHAARAAEVVLLSGWLKGQNVAVSGTYKYLTPLMSLTTRDGTLVLHIAPSQSDVFVESGSANLSAESRGGQVLKGGQFVSRVPRKPPVVSARMSSEFTAAIPIPFRDTLPARYSRFAGKQVEAPRDHDVTYPEVAEWLAAPLAWRRGMVSRFEPRLSDAAFRSSVDAHMKQHPEWDPILHPEKYQQKVHPASANAVTPPGS
jgi:hypothetical protein